MNINANTHLFDNVPESSRDLFAQKAQRFLMEKMNVPEEQGITIRVTKNRGRYYVTEWRTGEQSVWGGLEDTPIARISPVKDEKGKWQLAWMKRDLKWHNLIGYEYRGSFEQCLETIVEDPDCAFWG